jgi:hypothetical protein
MHCEYRSNCQTLELERFGLTSDLNWIYKLDLSRNLNLPASLSGLQKKIARQPVAAMAAAGGLPDHLETRPLG